MTSDEPASRLTAAEFGGSKRLRYSNADGIVRTKEAYFNRFYPPVYFQGGIFYKGVVT